jgi:MerR, DNA binding
MPAPSRRTSHHTACAAVVNAGPPLARAGPTMVPEIATPRVVPVCWPAEASDVATPAIERGMPETAELYWIAICTRLRATGMPIKTIRRYAELVSAGPGNEGDRLALLEAHRAEVTARLAELQENLELIDRKIDVYRGRLAAGEADHLWAPTA